MGPLQPWLSTMPLSDQLITPCADIRGAASRWLRTYEARFPMSQPPDSPLRSRLVPNVYDSMVERLLPPLVENFLMKSGDYGEDGFQELGARGQYSEIHRKVKKIKRVLWDGEELKHESVEEVVADLFGHILILTYLLKGSSQEVRSDGVGAYSDKGRCETRSTKGLRCRNAEHGPGINHLFGE